MFFQKVLSFLQKQVHEEPLPAKQEEGILTQDFAPIATAARTIAFIDAEISTSGNKICDLGAVREDKGHFHSNNPQAFLDFIAGADYVCGHNILRHDLLCLERAGIRITSRVIDTLPLSPLLFPKRPYHALLKDDKLQVDELNNPVSDCKKAAHLFHDEVNAFHGLPSQMQGIYYGLLKGTPSLEGFFSFLDLPPDIPGDTSDLVERIRAGFAGRICARAELDDLVTQMPEELAYALALINTDDPASVTPPWVLHSYPQVASVIRRLRHTPCRTGCPYCTEELDVHKGLQRIFGFESFRTYNGEPLQEKAAQAAVAGHSLLAVFPTGGGKSITFQLPALMAGKCVHGLTVVISPLQSLMKDQVDNLEKVGITEAVTINGLLDPVERANALERIEDGSAALLYISPEQLRSRTIEKLLLSRNVVRFVIDEAHCFSAWGQDFRVDYQYIGHFIRELQEGKRLGKEFAIPVSCFTATAKQKVISDICQYFRETLNLDLQIFASSSTRKNLHYKVLFRETDEEKYITLRDLLGSRDCPAIVYVSRTRQTEKLARKLASDGFAAVAFHGKMDPADKIESQEAFMRGDVRIIVATSAFGMGVDKKDVGLVVHYDISASLEDYVQESGRAGRDPSLQADCYVLYNDADLDRHFLLLNQTKLSLSEIQQVWRAVRTLTRRRPRVWCSPLEVAREAGWDESGNDIETRVRTALAALENAGYLERGKNMPRVYATSILVKNMLEAGERLEKSTLFSDAQRLNARRIMTALLGSRSRARAENEEAESRVDYLADRLGIVREEVVQLISLLRLAGLLSDMQDMSAYIHASDTENKSLHMLEQFAKLEKLLLGKLKQEGVDIALKELNEEAQEAGIARASVRNLRTLVNYHIIRKWVHRPEYNRADTVRLVPALPISTLQQRYSLRIALCRFIITSLYNEARTVSADRSGMKPVCFSVVGLYNSYRAMARSRLCAETISLKDMEDALLYLSRIQAMKLEGGFLVLYNAMEIRRLIENTRIQYKKADYQILDEFYKQKTQQVHIIGHYAHLVVDDYEAALQFVQDYFQMDYKKFIAKYFRADEIETIGRTISAQKYKKLFGSLSTTQKAIINAGERLIVVAAGPGSGKTMVLVHKLASLLLLEDVKAEQLLMLTFSRAAATEFRKRLVGLIGPAAHFVEITTFHSYSFDLLGRVGRLEGVENVVQKAADMIRQGEIEPGKITKSVLVLDEAQDMAADEFSLVQALMQHNEGMRLIAVGDDDQNIFAFRGADSGFLRSLVTEHGAVQFEMTENYRSGTAVVSLANAFATTIHKRMKKAPIRAMRQEQGKVCITRHYGRHMETAVVGQILATCGKDQCCLLTKTNDEALQLTGLLLKKGVRASLIQSMEHFRLFDLLEVRHFLKWLDNMQQSPVISDEAWETAKTRLERQYATSSCLANCKRLLQDFEATHREKYRSDLENFIRESAYDDFSDVEAAVTVSTIHKAKGREFDKVYMLLNGYMAATDDDRRTLYVGMTRAKRELYIHCNTDILACPAITGAPGVTYLEDKREYGEPEEIALQLTHRDVVLDFFKGKKKYIFGLRSGDPLYFTPEERGLHARVDGKTMPVVRYSKAFRDKLQRLTDREYRPYAARIRFIVAWKGKEDTEETAIVLPDIVLRRS